MTRVTVLEVPQWQGSGSATAQRLQQGAAALAGLIPADELLRIDIDGGPRQRREGVAGHDVLVANLTATRAARAGAAGRLVMTAGGDCGVELAPIEAALAEHGSRLAVVWFDAHGDLNTPASSPSGAFHGMVLRTLLGEGPPALVPHRPLRPSQVVLAGVRTLDPGERAYIETAGIARVDVPQLAEPSSLVDAVAATGATVVYIHIDLDVLDPLAFASVGAPEPGGLAPDRLAAAVHALAARFPVAGAGLTEYQPGPAADREVLARLATGLPLTLDPDPPDGPARLERFAAAAWPTTHVERSGGWLLRRTPEVARRRSNSALPPPAGGDPAQLDAVDAFYRRHGLPVRVQVAPAEQHSTLDALLATRGYAREAPVLVLTASVEQVIENSGAGPVTLDSELTGSWRRAFVDLVGNDDSATVADRVLPRVPAPAGYASAVRDGEVAGIGLFVAAPGWAGVFCMATQPRHRRRGIGAAILSAGARWAAGHGVERLYLQVEEGNEPARRLYERAGFRRSHSYHYRTRS